MTATKTVYDAIRTTADAVSDMLDHAESQYHVGVPINTVAKYVTNNWRSTAPPSSLATFNAAINRTYDVMLEEGTDPEINRPEFWIRVRESVPAARAYVEER